MGRGWFFTSAETNPPLSTLIVCGSGVLALEDSHPSHLYGHQALCPYDSLANLSSSTALVARGSFAREEQLPKLWEPAGYRDSFVGMGRTADRKGGGPRYVHVRALAERLIVETPQIWGLEIFRLISAE